MSEKIRNILPLGFPWQTQDPFLFCVHHKDFYPEGNENLGPKASLAGRNLGSDFAIKDGWRMYHGQQVPGFPAHPHRGFETVTIARQGFVDHSDSLGAAGRFGEGDVQWMTAGKGVQHCEMFPLLNENGPNTLEIFQIWLNLPAKNKMVDAHFDMLWAESIPEVKISDENGKASNVRVIAGTFEGHQAPPPAPNSWAKDPQNEVMILTFKMEAGAKLKLPPCASGDCNRSLYFFDGTSITIDGRSIPPQQAIFLNPNHEIIIENGDVEGDFLVLQGKPIGEPVAQYGPFVMNSNAEIQGAIADYQQTQFGGWPWSSSEQVHSKEKGRFAKFVDGTLVTK